MKGVNDTPPHHHLRYIYEFTLLCNCSHKDTHHKIKQTKIDDDVDGVVSKKNRAR